MMQKIRSLFVAAIALAASFITGSAWADAPTPVAVWNGNFSELTKDGITIDLNGNYKAEDNSYLQITQDYGVKLTGFSLKAPTILVGYENLSADDKTANKLCFVTLGSSATDDYEDLVGAAVIPSTKEITGINSSGWWEKAANRRAKVSYPMATTREGEHFFAYSQDHSGNTGAYFYLNDGGNYFKIYWGHPDLKATSTALNRAAIGGPARHGSRYSGYAITPCAGMKITRIAIFDKMLSAAELAEFSFEPVSAKPGTVVTWSNLDGVAARTSHYTLDNKNLTLTEKTGLPTGSKVAITKIIYGSPSGKSWPATISINGNVATKVESDIADPTTNIGDNAQFTKLETYTFSEPVEVIVGQSYPISGSAQFSAINSGGAIESNNAARTTYAAVEAVVMPKIATATLTPGEWSGFWEHINWDGGVSPDENTLAEITVAESESGLLQFASTDGIVAWGITFKGVGSVAITADEGYNGGVITSALPISVLTLGEVIDIDAGDNEITYQNNGANTIEPTLTTTGPLNIAGTSLSSPISLTNVTAGSIVIDAGAKATVDEKALNNVSGEGTLLKTGSGTLNLGGTTAVDGTTVQIDGGKVDIGSSALKDATFVIGQDGELDNYGWFTMSGTFTINSDYDKTIFVNRNNNPARISGSPNIVKGGTGAITLKAAPADNNDFASVTVNAGKLVFSPNKGDFVYTNPIGDLVIVGSGVAEVAEGNTITVKGMFDVSNATSTPVTGGGTLDLTGATIKFPSTLAENTPFTLCTGILSGATDGVRYAYIGDVKHLVNLTFNDRAVSYAIVKSAEMDGKEYETVAAAVAAADGAEKTIKLLMATPEVLDIPKNITIDRNDKTFGGITGSGIIIYNAALPTASERNCYTAAAWAGTVWIKNYGTAGGAAVFDSYTNMESWGNADSVVRFTNCNGYINGNGNFDYALEMYGEETTGYLGWKDSSGWSTYAHSFKELIGNGQLDLRSSGKSCAELWKFGSIEGFSGELILCEGAAYGKRVVVGSGTIGSDKDGGKLLIEANKVAKISSGKTWSAIETTIDGTLSGTGTLASAVIFNEGSSVVASLDGALTITGAITGTVEIDGSAIDEAETKPDYVKVLTATAETKPTCELFGVEGYELFWKGDDLYAGDSAKRALYKQFSYAGAIYTWRGANEIANAASLYYVFDPDFGIDQGTVEGVDYFKGNGTKYANVPGGKATEHNFWTTFAYSNSTGNNGEGYEAPGCVLRFVESSTYNKTIGGGFGPLSLGGLLVEKGATGYNFKHTDGARSNLLGDPTGTAQTYWAIYENFAYNRNGAIYLSGALVFDVADGKVFDLNSGRDANSQSPILVQKIGIGSNGNFGQSVAGGTLIMKGGGKLKVAKLTALGSTLDYSNLELERETAFIEGNLTVDKDTTFMFPKGFEPTSEDPDSSFKLCDGTLTAAVNGKRMVSFGDTVKLVDMTFSTDGTVTYVDVNEKSWTGDGADTNWSTSANWDPADKPTANADVKIAAENDDVAINLDENTAELSSLSFLGSYDVAFSGTGEITATTIDFVYMTGKIILGADGLTLNGTASGAMIVDPSVVPAGTTFLKGTAIATANVSFVNVPDGVAVVKTDAGYEMKSATEFLRYGYAFEDNVTAEPGAAATLSIGGNHAYTDGVRTRALQFTSGQNHGTDFGFGGGDFTIFAVIKAPTETGKCIFALGGQQGTDGLLGLRTAGANSVAVFTKGSTDLMTVSVEDSATMYHYYALKYDSTAHTIALSVDGGEFGEPVEYTCSSTAKQFQFGGIYSGGTSGKTDNATNGAIDEFQLYTKKLAVQQIQTLGAAFEPNTWKGENGGAWATASNWSYNEVPADGASVIIPTGDTAEEYKIVLASDATISLGSVKVTGAATSFEFKNGEVTMGALKSDVDIQIGENDMLCFSTANAITLAANKFIKGNGTIVYVNVLPGNEKTSYQASATWTGTVWLKDYTTSVGWVYGNQYGNGNSKIKLTNFVGYFYPYEAQTITAELVLVDEDNHVAYTLRNGNSNDNVFINKLSGSGSIVGWSGDATQRLLVKDWTYYTGNLNMFGGRGVKFGADGQAAKDHIEVGAGATYILSGQRWVANGIDVNGTIGGTGTLNGAIAFGNGSVLDSTSTQGMLTVDSFGMSIGAPTVKVVADATEEPKVMNGAFADVDTPVVYNATLVKGEETLGGVYMLVTRKDGVYAVKQSQPVNLQLVVNAGETKTFTAGETVQYVNYPSLNADGTIAVDVANLEAGAYDLAVWKYLPAATFAGYGRPLVNITNIPEGWDAELMFQVDKISLLLRDPDWISRTPITIMPLGDSITESVANFYSNYRVLLYQKLALAGYNVKSAGYWRGALNGSREPTGVNTTHTEWELQAGKASERAGKLNTSANIEDGWSNMLDLAGDPDVILLHIGINDIDDPYMTTYGYITDLTKKIMQARPNSVLILSAPMGAEYGQTYQKADTVGDRAHNNYDETWVMPLHDKLVEFFNDAKDGNVEGVDKDRIFFADLTTNVRGRWYADEVNVPYYCLDDHLHPGWIGDNLMANTWFEQVRAAFPDPTAKFHEGRTDAEKGVYTDKDLGAENNVPDAYKAGFVKARQLKDSLTGTEHFTPGDPFTYDDTNENLADNVKVKKVGYYVEYVRETPTKNIHRFVWVDMDAPDNQTLANVGFPYAAKNQSVVSKLHVYGNHPGVYNVDSNDDTVTGFVEFTPYGYSSGASSVSGAPANWYEFDWNDTLNSSGSGYGCMQVHRILNPAEFSRQGQVVFAYNGWSYSDNKTELGIGNFGQFFTTKSVDWTWLHNTELGAASNYKIQNIEIWIKPTDLVTDDDGKVYETIEDAINNGERQEGATLTANKDTDINLGELTSDKPFKLDAKAIAMDKIGWTDIEPTEAEGSGRYLACGSDGTLTVKTDKPTGEFTSFECYVLGIDASKQGGDKPVLNAPPDDGNTSTLTASIDTARTIKGVNIKLIAEPNDGSGLIEATGKFISLGLPGSGERIYTIKVEVEEATNP